MRKSLELSPYNIVLPGPDPGSRIVVNSHSRSFVVLDERDASALEEGQVREEIAPALEQIGALTHSPEAQHADAFEAFDRERANQRNLVVVLPLTSACNMKCSYCYQVIHGEFQGKEARDIERWNEPSVDALVAFVRRQLGEGEYRGLRVRWYGGEPLLQRRLLREIGARLELEAQRAGVAMSGMVVTNGTRLDAAAMADLRAVHVDRLEISVDGPQHDRLRPLRNGDSSYEQILSAIEVAALAFETIVFRVNVHRENFLSIPAWLEEIAPRIRRENIFLKFKLVEGDKSSNLDYQEFSEALLSYKLATRRLGLKCIQKALTTETCPAIRHNYFIIQSDLKVYKCPQNLGSDDHVGIIAADGEFAPTWRLEPWQSFHVKHSPGCTTCSHLPHCNGGCPYNEIMTSVRKRSLQVYQRAERCCSEKHVPELLVTRVL